MDPASAVISADSADNIGIRCMGNKTLQAQLFVSFCQPSPAFYVRRGPQ